MPESQIPSKSANSWGKWALGAAALALAAALGAKALSHRAEAPAPAPAAADAPANPDDAAAWKTLGESRYAAQDYPRAVAAFEHAASLTPGDAAAWSALGEARVMASPREPLPAAALAAFQRATAINPKDPRARYFLAVARDLKGDHAGAVGDWLALLADTPPGAPWEADLRRTIEQVARINHLDVAARLAAVRQPAPTAPAALAPGTMPEAMRETMPGPSAEQVRAASAIPPSQQQAMAEAMVARLETRLKGNPGNLDGWVMLMRSRMTLGQPEKAAAALHAAIAANPAEAGELRRQAGLLGVR